MAALPGGAMLQPRLLISALVVLVLAQANLNAGPLQKLTWPGGSAGTVATSTSAAALPACAESRTVLIQNNDSSIVVRLGPQGVTSSIGFRLFPGSAVEWEITAESVYAASESGTPTLNVICGVGGSVR